MKFASAFAGQVVCVAGAGGYIGSALVKVLAPAGLRSLVLLDSSEYALFEIQRWIRADYPAVSCQSILGSVGDGRLVTEMFARFRPQVVFHAAAYKHVGLLEENPFAAVENNALGTLTFAQASARAGIARFVLISTDKAANPHSVMGVSKRLAELFTLSLRGTSVIRLANVIGSPGSVIPLFLEQIEQGGTISITDVNAARYFLSRNEAVTAILAAGLPGSAGKLLLPRLGKPVRIVDLAKWLSGSESPPIFFAGLKPGEKLTEDLIGDGESRTGTIEGELTSVSLPTFSWRDLDAAVQRLATCVLNRDGGMLLEALSSLVPEYVPSKLMMECAAVVS